jgi:hypothetical protein
VAGAPRVARARLGEYWTSIRFQELTSAKYSARTEANVRDSDGTLIFNYGEPTGGTALTVKLANLHRKPVYIFDFEADALNQDPEKVWLWGHEHDVYVLNVAGTRESGKPGTRDLVEAVMLRVLEFARGAYPVREG